MRSVRAVTAMLSLTTFLTSGRAVAQTPMASIRDGVFTGEQASRGDRRFKQSCATCHDPGELTGRKFAAKFAGLSLGDLYETISTAMPANAPGTLKAEEYADVLAFFLRESGYPAGERELPVSADALKQIAIVPVAR